MESDLLFDLLKISSVSGHEEIMSDFIYSKMKVLTSNIEKDEIGNIMGYLNYENSIRLLLVAHMDEIGLMVTGIQEDGMIRVMNLGGIYPVSYLGQKVRIHTALGIIYGVVAISNRISRYKEINGCDLLIDIGGYSKKDVCQHVSIGDAVVIDTDYKELRNNCLTGRGLDNKIGIYVLLKVFEKISKTGCKIGLCIAATVGEETSKNGAFWVAQNVKPTISITVDTTYSNDYGITDFNTGNIIKICGGPVICHSPIVSKKINENLKKCASTLGINIQEECAGGKLGSDIDMIHKANTGVITSIVSIPIRYMHSPSEVACLKDIDACIDLLTEYIYTYV